MKPRLTAPDSEAVLLKPRGAPGLVPFYAPGASAPVQPEVAEAAIEEAAYVALDIETTGNSPFLVIEIGAERFNLAGSLSLFDTLVHARAPINSFARRRHLIDRRMLEGAPEFSDARRAFLHFATGAALVEHSHDAFDSYLIGRGLRRKLANPVLDTSTLARRVLDLPAGQTPGLARLVEELGVHAAPMHAALGDAQATAAVFRTLARRAMERFGWRTVGEMAAALIRPD
ncbi:MAG: 3'-5' exonuclease, partial [Candidatus Dormibacteraeota bacterium]|nr:3'-5' exonuclease [Candidatus Dormibacteraeota bacterium]